ALAAIDEIQGVTSSAAEKQAVPGIAASTSVNDIISVPARDIIRRVASDAAHTSCAAGPAVRTNSNLEAIRIVTRFTVEAIPPAVPSIPAGPTDEDIVPGTAADCV